MFFLLYHHPYTHSVTSRVSLVFMNRPLSLPLPLALSLSLTLSRSLSLRRSKRRNNGKAERNLRSLERNVQASRGIKKEREKIKYLKMEINTNS